jgi:hypothetical protein
MAGRKYLRIEIEGKGFVVDLNFVKPEEIKLELGYVEGTTFNGKKQITLESLEKQGFKLE